MQKVIDFRVERMVRALRRGVDTRPEGCVVYKPLLGDLRPKADVIPFVRPIGSNQP